MIVLNEIKQAEEVLRTGQVEKKSTITIMLLAKYFIHVRNYDEAETYIEIDKFLNNNYSFYNKIKWVNKIKAMISKAAKYKLRNLESISISKSEVEKIEEVCSLPGQRVLFSMLCLAKVFNATSEVNNGWVNTPINEIFQTAKVHPKNADDKYFMIHDFIQDGYLESSAKIDNINFRITFIGGEDEEIKITDLENLGYEWNNYIKYGNYGRCTVCNKLYKINSRCGKYCNKCAKEVKKEQDKCRKMQYGENKTFDFLPN